jgi:hypothetical protein
MRRSSRRRLSRMYRPCTKTLYQSPSGPVQAPVFVGCSVCCFPPAAWGARGTRLSVPRTPCPHAVPRASARSSRAGDARPARYAVGARAEAPAPGVPAGRCAAGTHSPRCGEASCCPRLFVVLFWIGQLTGWTTPERTAPGRRRTVDERMKTSGMQASFVCCARSHSHSN